MIINAITTTINRYPIFLLTIVGFFATYTKFLAGEGNEAVFRNDVVSGLLVLIAGIPAGLFLDSLRRKKEDEVKEIDNIKQELFILKSLSDELSATYEFLHTRRNDVTTVIASRVKSEVWDTLSTSGKLNYLSPALLLDFSAAYDVAKKISYLENYAIQSFASSAVSFTMSDGTQKSGAVILLEQARAFDTEFRNLAERAIGQASNRERELNNL